MNPIAYHFVSFHEMHTLKSGVFEYSTNDEAIKSYNELRVAGHIVAIRDHYDPRTVAAIRKQAGYIDHTKK